MSGAQTARARAGSWLVLCAAVSCALMQPACQNDSPKPQGGAQDSTGTSLGLACMPLSPRACPCLGAGTGMQSCSPAGDGYGPCTGCPAPAAPAPDDGTQLGAGTAGSAAPPLQLQDAGAASGGAGTAGRDAGKDGAQDADNAATDAGADAAQDALGLSPASGAPGVSCGVALPVLCSLEAEKCCVRSLQTDTCIGAEDSCKCDLPDCTVMETHCDGPEDCADGEVCCGTLANSASGDARYQSFDCAAQCDYAGSQRVACHQDEAPCPGNTVCANSQLLTNLQVCIDPATIRQ